MTLHRYTVILVPDAEAGGYVVEVPVLPHCVTQGDTVEEALAMAQNAISMWIRDLAADGEAIPIEREPSRLATIEVEW
jgi:predicted RNase H-like HicB family nuclease